MNTFGAGIWLLGVFYAKAPRSGALGLLEGGDHRFAFACAALGAAILLWANLRSPA